MISCVQYFHIKAPTACRRSFGLIFYLYGLLVEVLTTIEMLPAVAIGMYTYGADAAGDYCALMGFIAAVVSHFPKRFMFRTRPYIASRAL